ncbi:hypothetical protein SOPP22_17950 [Shewanella sp. OPT22]|nr:hypothetical protein SOPP22_17950 [Shewanella sp. OPT22]
MSATPITVDSYNSCEDCITLRMKRNIRGCLSFVIVFAAINWLFYSRQSLCGLVSPNKQAITMKKRPIYAVFDAFEHPLFCVVTSLLRWLGSTAHALNRQMLK